MWFSLYAFSHASRGVHKREEHKEDGKAHVGDNLRRPEIERGGSRRDEQGRRDAHGAAEPYPPAPAGEVGQALAVICRVLPEDEPQAVLRGVEHGGDEQKVRKDPEHHDECFYALHGLEEHEVAHQGEEWLCQTHTQIRAEGTDDYHAEHRQQQAGAGEPA